MPMNTIALVSLGVLLKVQTMTQQEVGFTAAYATYESPLYGGYFVKCVIDGKVDVTKMWTVSRDGETL